MSDEHTATPAPTTTPPTMTPAVVTGARPRQPWLHELLICVDGNATVVSGQSGDLEPGTVQGYYVDDVRILTGLRVVVGGEAVSSVLGRASGAQAQILGAARGLGDAGSDATVEVSRSRLVEGSTLTEVVSVTSHAIHPVRAPLRVTAQADGRGISDIKAGVAGPLASGDDDGSPALRHTGTIPDTGPVATFPLARHTVAVGLDPAPHALATGRDTVAADYELDLAPGGNLTITISVTARRDAPSAFDADPGSGAVTWDDIAATGSDPRVGPLVAQSVADLRHLLQRDPESHHDVFAAAGTPWYLTLFGRDSLWSARLMLPFGTDLAAGTLRALARRQGTQHDETAAEQPGKILHEVRRTAYLDPVTGMSLPTRYYGSVDATALWVCLLVDAWRWGMPEPQVRSLLPTLRRALGWIMTDAQPGGDGLLRYLDTTGTGLANQGWKDSPDAMRRRDGSIAPAPIALVEAQAYAVEALEGSADLVERLGEEGDAGEWRAAADRLRTRIREGFWVSTDAGRYLAMALDADGAPVDGLGSNMGHVLGTGALTPAEARAVATTLTGEELLDEFGVRTMGSANGGYNPLGYHTGSIWTHDTAIIALGLHREGLTSEASRVAATLLRSGAAFDDRWPELCSGESVLGRPAPYPASCRPQAWSAAAVGALVTVALGLQPDAPGGALGVVPPQPLVAGPIRVTGLRFGGHQFTVEVDASGSISVRGLPPEVQVRT